MIRRGLSVRVLAPKYTPTPAESSPVDEMLVARFRGTSPIRNAWRLVWILMRYRIDHLIVGDAGAIADFLEVPTPSHISYSVVVHGTEVMRLFHPVRSELLSADRDRLVRFVSSAQAVIHSNRAVLKLIHECELDQPRCFLIYPAVRQGIFNPATNDLVCELRERYGLDNRRALLCVARLGLDKGHDVLLDAFTRVVREHSDVKLILAGDGPQREHLEELVDHLEIRDSVIFAGEIPSEELAAHHEISEFFVMPSRSIDRFEGFGIVFVEAAVCGRTSIGGNQGGTQEAIEDGRTGLLVDPADVDAVVAAINKLLNDCEFRDLLAKKAQERASAEFSLERMAECLVDHPGVSDRQWPGFWPRTGRLIIWTFNLSIVSCRRALSRFRTFFLGR